MSNNSLKEMSILRNCININKLVRDSTHLFSFDTLSLGDKLALLSADFKFYKGIIKPEEFSLTCRVAAMKRDPNHMYRFPITDLELRKLSNKDYVDLLELDFKKFIRADVFDKLTCGLQTKIFLKNPEWVYDNTDFRPVFSRYVLDSLISYNKNFLQNHIENITILKSSAWFWGSMLEYDKSNVGVFLKNIQSVSTKSETRAIFKDSPSLIKLLTSEIMQKSNLNSRDWVLLIESLVNNNTDMFEGWALPADVRADLSLDITSILLSGQNKLSKQLSNSIKSTIL